MKMEDLFLLDEEKEVEYNYDVYYESQQAATLRYSIIRGKVG